MSTPASQGVTDDGADGPPQTNSSAIKVLDAALESLLKSDQSLLYENRDLDTIPGLVSQIIQDSTPTGSNENVKITRTPVLIEKLLAVLLQYIKACDEQKDEDDIDMSTVVPMENPNLNQARRYNHRAIRWANDCIADLMAPHDDTSIPALDALLMTISDYDPMKHELVKYRSLKISSSSNGGGGAKDDKEQQG
eukprot:CAMPEP_0204616820 /NCGR_PEP_ID=MMETSP0717-20131115/3974_1 /ASSEMBLY_ACC=CAM_ASM_000666 /TAXON_ID=230516 /ORGANISM="Chaetoceros curvisetus" /LENGTH=193 /DNA_ID=CAMNT_0051630181 /DNA_START=217 /DNA_END=798 /DNA_ORIENTATION=-